MALLLYASGKGSGFSNLGFGVLYVAGYRV